MYMVMKAMHGEFLGDMECIGSYAHLADAQRCMVEDMWAVARREGADVNPVFAAADDEVVHNFVDADGLDYGCCDLTDAQWRIFELKTCLMTRAETKVCPDCGTEVLADMDVCYGCLHKFDEE